MNTKLLQKRPVNSNEVYSLDEFLRADEVAKLLKLGVRTIYEYIKEEKLPAYQFGKEYRILKQDLDTFIASSALKKVSIRGKGVKQPTVMDLFCGCGGLSYGFMKKGFKVVLGVDNWKEALETFAANHGDAKTCEADLSAVTPEEIAARFSIPRDGIDVIIGGPPCQGFSIAGKRQSEDPRNKLYKGFVSFVDHFRPRAFIMENVPNLVAMEGGAIRDQIISDFEKIGYGVSYKVLRASDYGVPQHRRRVVFVGLRDGGKFDFPEPSHGKERLPFVSSIEALADLPDASLPNGITYPSKPSSEFQKMMREDSVGVFNHETTHHAEKTVEIISLVPDGGNYKDLPENLRHTRKVNIAWTRIKSWEPSFTIDTGHRHHFHYSYNRIPTVRESARIQSFPDRFIFQGSKTSQYKQVGNAVPPLLAENLAASLLPYIS